LSKVINRLEMDYIANPSLFNVLFVFIKNILLGLCVHIALCHVIIWLQRFYKRSCYVLALFVKRLVRRLILIILAIYPANE
jgi:hypothetical protein